MRLFYVVMKDMHLVVAAMSGEAYVAKIKKDGTMSDNRQKIPRSEVWHSYIIGLPLKLSV